MGALLIEMTRTNFVHNYRTNWKTLNLTNSQTIVIMKTNWITQPVTNTVEIDLIASQIPAPDSAATASPQPKPAPDAATPQPSAIPTDAVRLASRRTATPSANNQAEVRLSVRWASGAPAPFLVQHWRVERLDGAILCFGQDQDFVRALSLGEYKVEVRGKQDATRPLLVSCGTLSLTANSAVVKQKVIAKR